MNGYDQEKAQDVRHMLSEILSVARRRRWVFIIPAAIGALAALAYTFTYPRVYSARTLFERRDSLFIASLVRDRRYNPYSFAQLQRSIYVDIKGYKAVERVVEQLSLDKDLPRDADGELTDEGQRAKQAMINELSAKCEVYLEDKTETRDTVRVIMPNKDPVVAAALVTGLRDNYISHIQGRISEVLTDAQEHFKKEADLKREMVSRLEAELVRFRSQFLEVDPADPDAVVSRMTALQAQREDLIRRIEELETEIRVNETALGKTPSSTSNPRPGGEQPKLLGLKVAMPPTEPNPAYVDRQNKVQAIKDQILEKRMTMTDEHPEVRRLRRKMAQLEEELSHLPPTIAVTARSATGQTPRRAPERVSVEERIRMRERARIEVSLRNLKHQLGKTRRELVFLDKQIDRYETEKDTLFDRREEYLARQNELTVMRKDLAGQLGRYNEVTKLLRAEKNKRGIMFTVLEETQVSGKPVSPKLGRLMAVSLGFGAAMGLACVLLLELLDRTFRSVGQVASALHLPVLQSIGQIVTPELRRRRLAKQMAMHVVAVTLIGLVVLASGLVYVSLERPRAFDQLKADPGLLTRRLVGSGP